MSKPIPAAKYLPKPGPAMAADTLRILVTTTNDYVTTLREEKTKRLQIESWERIQLEIIHVQRDFLLTALDLTFDERRENFRALFERLDIALVSDREDSGALVADILTSITDLARTSPFKDLKSPELVVQEFFKSEGIIEL